MAPRVFSAPEVQTAWKQLGTKSRELQDALSSLQDWTERVTIANNKIRRYKQIKTIRRFLDKGLTRFGGFLNLIVASIAIITVGASLVGLPWIWVILASMAAAAFAARSGWSFLQPPDPEIERHYQHSEMSKAESTIEANRLQKEVEKLRIDLDFLKKSYLDIKQSFESRINRLRSCDWEDMAGVDFERFLADVFEELGYHVETTKITGDQGVDLIATAEDKRIAIQAKGYPRSTVGNGAVQEAHTGMSFYACNLAVVITNSTFTAAAMELASKVECVLIDGSLIPELIEGRLTLFRLADAL
jgi:HJR/Mrr/RecB family endonuclease